MMTNWKREQSTGVSLESEGVSFGIDGKERERKPRDKSKTRCWRCRKVGHQHRNCLQNAEDEKQDMERDGSTNIQDGNEETAEQLLIEAAKGGEFDNESGQRRRVRQ